MFTPPSEWKTWDASAYGADSELSSEGDTAIVTITNGGNRGHIGDIQWYEYLPLTEGQSYKIKFKAKASLERTIYLTLMDRYTDWDDNNNLWDKYWQLYDIPITTEWEDYEFDIPALGSEEALANHQNNIHVCQRTGKVNLLGTNWSFTEPNSSMDVASDGSGEYDVNPADNLPEWDVINPSYSEDEGNRMTLTGPALNRDGKDGRGYLRFDINYLIGDHTVDNIYVKTKDEIFEYGKSYNVKV